MFLRNAFYSSSLCLFLTGTAHGAPEKTPTLFCPLNKAQAIAIMPLSDEVFLLQLEHDPQKMAITKFVTYKCPHCYEFVGTLGETAYAGMTKSFSRDGRDFPSLQLSIAGKEPKALECTIEEVE